MTSYDDMEISNDLSYCDLIKRLVAAHADAPEPMLHEIAVASCPPVSTDVANNMGPLKSLRSIHGGDSYT